MVKGNKELYKKIYKITYLANIIGLINELNYINMIQKLSMNGFKTYHIIDFDKLTLHMKNIGLNDSFNISTLLYLRDNIYNEITNIALNFEDIGSIFSNKKKKIINRINKIRKSIKDKLNIIKSFKKIDRILYVKATLVINNIDTIKSNNTRKLTDDKIMEEWESHTRNELINRLILIVERYYTLEQLVFMNVELRNINVLESCEYIELENYYISVISKIENELRKWMLYCKIYIDIEIKYTECCQNIINNQKTNI